MSIQQIALAAFTLTLAIAAACANTPPVITPAQSVTLVPTDLAAPTPPPSLAPGADSLTEARFRALLATEDVERVLISKVPLKARFFDYKTMAENVEPAQVVNIDSWFGLSIVTAGNRDGVTFTLIDFDSPTSATAHFEKMRSAKKAPPEVEAAFGGNSFRVEVNAHGIGSMMEVIRGDQLLSFHTVTSEGQPPLFTLERLDELAALVVSRLYETPKAAPTTAAAEPFSAPGHVTATPTPTPSPTREWDLERIQVDGSTVTVLLQVYAGIDVRVMLDAREPDQVKGPPPVIQYVFQDVAPGEHTIEVMDVVGFTESAEVVVP